MINNIKYCYYIFDYIDNSLDTIENEKNGEILLIYLHNFNNYCCLQIIFYMDVYLVYLSTILFRKYSITFLTIFVLFLSIMIDNSMTN